MQAAYISALAALAGSAIGGLTSFATSWTTQQAQARTQRAANEKDKREALFGRFLDEAARLYADALQNKREDAAALMIGIYALTNRIRLSSSARVVESADAIARIIMDAYLSPNMTLQEVRNTWVEQHIDPLRDFSEACREELGIFGKFQGAGPAVQLDLFIAARHSMEPRAHSIWTGCGLRRSSAACRWIDAERRNSSRMSKVI